MVPAVPLVLAVLAGCSATPEPATADAGHARSSTASDAPGPDKGTESSQETKGTLPPAKVDIPSVGITSSLMVLGLNADGTVEVPPAEKGMTAGWYAGGPVPGEAGPAVIIGHNDTRFGKAVFHDLKKIAKGAAITVTNTAGADAHFTVTGTESVGKNAFPTEKVYGATKDHALRLITCDGGFDAQGHPVNNLIVYATQD
ncbi:class F sortase [Streptomyces corynorhini]|uniref:Class F sortase n=1 Tax=Streptomyces corynorhini TaxID=2282652 RepID=A0A370ATZ1_9ACTN|nr:class F sortase [Streptomyces corynorhini]RDG33038.1 class F sortase [Streptomyces corynorhini]